LEFPIYLKLCQNKKSNDQKKFQLTLSLLLWKKDKKSDAQVESGA
jgi:hypothetical protein